MRPAGLVMPRSRRAGFSLVELIIALLVGGIVMGAAYRMLAGNQRFYRAQAQVAEVEENLRAVSLILPAEFRELDATDGDIVAMSDTSISIRAMRVFAFICAPTVSASGYVTLRNSLLYGYRAVDATRDSALVYMDGDVQFSSDDRWLQSGISAVTTSGITCSDGTAGTRLTLTGMTGGLGKLDSVTVGSPVRTFERVRYRLYDDGTGTWWLGVESMVSGAYQAISPVAGPLQPNTGISFTYYDAAGAVTATPTSVASIRVTARGRSTQPINTPGRAFGYYEDSLSVRVALRNN